MNISIQSGAEIFERVANSDFGCSEEENFVQVTSQQVVSPAKEEEVWYHTVQVTRIYILPFLPC